MRKNFSCYIISETSLGLQCAEALFEKGHKILGIISAHQDTIAWVTKQNIPLYNSLEDFKASISSKTFDYLFSIVNRRIIKKEFLAYPRIAAINYHDAPLPKYAGVHATSWAILNNESFYGISWHLMNEMTDGGGILKQVTFSLDKDETALTLNLKCYSYALESFRILIQELMKGSLTEKKQDLTKRSYFARYQKPDNLGFLCWKDSAQEIERSFRALSFGDYPNALATPKILINETIFIPNKVDITLSDSQTRPGTIVQITSNSLQISTKTQDVILTGFKDIRGKSVNIEAFLVLSNVEVGSIIKSPTQEDRTHWVNLSENLAPHEDYWVHEIENSSLPSLPFIELPTQNNKEQSSKEEIIIKDTLSECFSPSRKGKKITFSEMFLAVFCIYLSRLGKASTLTIGIVNDYLKGLHNRYSSLLPSHLPLTLFLEENEKAKDLIEQVKNKLDSLKENKMYLEDIYIRHPKLKDIPPSATIVINLDSIHTETMNENFPFVLTLDEDNNAYVFKIKTNLNETSKNLLHNFKNHIKKLFAQIVQNPEECIRDFSFISEEEKFQLLIEWNDTKAAYPENKTIHQLFEEQVEKTPDNIAVVYEDQELTYKQLNEKSNQLAHYLRNLGVGPDTLVAIAVERSLEMIIGLLGILKAGGAYVPLDPEYPQDRLQFMLEDTQASVLITQEHLTERFKTHSGKIIDLQLQGEKQELLIKEASFEKETLTSTEWQTLPETSTHNPISITLPHHLAYVIYTSGSTGKPKGVLIDQRGLSNRLIWMQKQYELNPSDRIFQKTSFTFDVSVWELFLPLIVGSTEFIAKPQGHKDTKYLLDLIYKKRISITHFVPSMLTSYLEESNLDALKNSIATLRLVITSGEALSLNLAKEYYTKGGSGLHNLYGPTEASIDVTSYSYNPEDNGISVPIGTPIANTQIYILDQNQQPVPIGVSGEIYIGGVGLARGYLNRPDLTAKKFVPNPFATEKTLKEGKSLRLYRTGDLARYLPDGNIEFLGRIDDQVKIRGFRIELGEIESTLSQHGDVSQAVVIAREDEPGDKKLIAYVIPQEKLLASLEKETLLTSSSQQEFAVLQGEGLLGLTETLRTHLSRSLPDYMIPSFFVFLDKIPLTPNGKIDRKSLPAPDLSLRQVGEEYVAPHSPLEQELCKIWSEVLRIEKIGIHDNFFRIGGHSLLATQVISRIRAAYNVDLPLRALFDHPTILTLSQDIEDLQGKNLLSHIPPMVARQRPESLPLSFAQQRLWFLDQLIPDTALYNVPTALKLSGSLNIPALEKAFNSLITRHETLRTLFPVAEGEAHQLILPHLTISLEEDLTDLSLLNSEEQTLSVEKLSSEEANTPFNLSTGPLIRVKLLKLTQEDHVLLLTMHHIVSDGWSMEIFFKELAGLYNAYTQGSESTLPPLPIQYADFALWQRNWLQGDVLEQQLSYWKNQLSDIPDLLELPTDKPRPKELTYQGAYYRITLSKEIKDQLNQLSQQQGCSLFMTLLAIFQILLHRYTGQKDIVVGSPIANRHYKEIEGLIGFFVNTLALKTTFEGTESFLDTLHQVKDTTLHAYQHQDVPFEQLVDHLSISRELNRNPVFQVMFVLQNANTEEGGLKFKGIETSPAFSSYPVAKFDLDVSVAEYEEEIEVNFNYAIELFEEETIRRLAVHFEELIKASLKDPTYPVQTLSLLTPSEKQQLLIEWNDTKGAYPENKTIHQLFEEQVEKTPDNIAVVYEDQELTYKQLNEKSNQLAHYLRNLGVGPDTLVAIAVERSLEMIIGLLGILKAGGAYVPLDPEYPQDRLQFMLEDTQASVLITQEHLIERFKTHSGKIIDLQLQGEKQELLIKEASFEKETLTSTEWQTLPETSTHNPISITLPHHLAYVIYTSGSTGKPKGVETTHEGLRNRLEWTLNYYSITEKDSLLHIAALSFDISVWEMLFPLFRGASLVIAGERQNKDILSIVSLIKSHQITTLHFVPSLLKLFVDSKINQESQSVMQIITGGEPLSNETRKKSLSCFKDTHLYLAYGPTEAAISVTHWDCSQAGYTNKTPIGRPIANTQIYILDQNQNPVPIGVSGEIYIGGVGLARGYLNRPDLTAEKFVPNPFATEETLKEGKSLRLYRTGDLARYLPDGNIEFLGRIDDQVKIRGFRIELGEIESTLSQHGDVSQAVVIAREDEPGDKKLIAYVIPQEKLLASLEKETLLTSSSQQEFAVLQGEGLLGLTETLRTHLSRSLPDYMIPSFFVFLDKIPLTPNGKIDRKSLPAPDLSLRQVGEEYVAPHSPLEQELCKIWSEVLRIEKIGIHDNFFRIGGDSIISIQIVAKARQKNIFFAVKDIFNNPTIAGLSLVAKSQEDLLTLKPDQGLVSGEIPLTPIQHWFFEQQLDNPLHYNQAVLLQARDQIDPSLLSQAFDLLVSHHDILRCRYHQKSLGVWIQTNLNQEDLSSFWAVFDLSSVSDQDLASHIEHQAALLHQSLDIEKGPLLKVALFNGGTRPSRLLIVIHHLAVDGVSWRILLEDFERVYQSLKEGKVPSLPKKTHAFQQWGHSLLQYAQSEEIKNQRPYWQNIEDSLNLLPTDFDKGPCTSEEVHTLAVSLTQEETTSLLQTVPKAYRTQINDILLTALTLAIGDWTQNYTLSLDLEGHGREEDIIPDMDLSRTIGWFTSVFPVHLSLENPEDLGESIKTIKETLRQIPHKGVGYGILKYLSQDKPLSSSSLNPSLSFNYLGQWDNTLSQGPFTSAPESAGNPIASNNRVSHLLNINGEVRENILHVFWTYSTHHYKTETIERVTHSFKNRLKQIIHHCSQEDNFGYTLSDFNLLSLSQFALDKSFGRIPRIESIYPLSPMQSGLLFQALYAPTSDAYFIQSVFELEGDVDVSILQATWQKVSDHHPILRTGFVWEGLETLLQYVLETAQVPFIELDWTELTGDEQQETLDTYIQEDRHKGFDLNKAPLFRITLIRCSQDKHYMLWSQHHILTDGWCLPILLGDVFRTYIALQQGNQPQLTPRRPYRDYIAWLQKQDITQAETFWKDYLSSVEEPTRLSFKGLIQPNERDYENYSLVLSHEETDRLKRFAQDNGLTLNTVIQGAVGLILRKYTGQAEPVMGVTVSGRNIDLPGVEEMVGLFINTLPLKISSQPEDNILSFLTRLQEHAQKLNEYAYTPLAQIQSWSTFNQSLFDVLFVFENYPIEEQSSEDKSSLKMRGIKGIEKAEYPLTIVVGPGRQLYLNLAYQTENFDETFIKRLGDHICQVLREMLVCKTSIQGISLLTPSEKQQLLIEWNDTKAAYPENKTIHQLFEEQVEKTPDNSAVVYEDQELTYKQLNEKSNQLAHYLREKGVGPDTLVAIAVERSLEMIIGLLGILKAGGAYVPLDPEYPQDRLQFMLEDTQASVLITQEHLTERFKTYSGKIVDLQLQGEKQELLIKEASFEKEMLISTEWQALPETSTHNPISTTLSHHLAYVIYTSGSTGRPKGVVLSQESAVNLINTQNSVFNVQQSTKLLQFASVSFDAAVSEVWTALSKGASLHLVNNEILLDKRSFTSFITKHDINLATIPPSFLSSFNANDFLHLKTLVIAGEATSSEFFRVWSKNRVLINAYGPTEGTVCSSIFLYKEGKERYSSVPIGTPIANTQIYILDQNQQPVPIGVSGEIYIGGVGLARGYLNRPDLTAEKFVPNPFATDETLKEGKSLRLYRTGDLARYLPDGNIEFLGRIDDQVKIRGFRIELGEIESTLSQHGDVSQAVVIAREDEPGDKKLVAYVIPQEKILASLEKETLLTSSSQQEFAVLQGEGLLGLTETLRNHLSRSLPDYMIPSFFVFLDKIPLTPNGKIDRKSLPAPDLSLRQVGEEYVAPHSPLEQELCKIWSEVLRIEKIGIHDNFFRIGGHSLLAVKVISFIQKKLSQKIIITDIFTNPTIHSLSQMLISQLRNRDESYIFPIKEGLKAPILFMVHPVGGLAYCYNSLAYYINSSIYGINNPTLLGFNAQFSSIEEIALFYIKLIQKIQKQGPYYVAGWSTGGIIAFEISRQLHLLGEKVEHLLLIDTGNPKKLAKASSQKETLDINEEDVPDFVKNLIEDWDCKIEKYDIQKYEGKTTLLRAKDGLRKNERNNHGWYNTIKKLDVIYIPGSHTSLFDDQNIETTAQAIKNAVNISTERENIMK